MTRDEALKIINPIMSDNKGSSPERALNVFVALGMLKLDEPPSPMDKLETELRKVYFSDSDMLNLKQALLAQNLEVVEKTNR